MTHVVVDFARDPPTFSAYGNSGESHYVQKVINSQAYYASLRCTVGFVSSPRKFGCLYKVIPTQPALGHLLENEIKPPAAALAADQGRKGQIGFALPDDAVENAASRRTYASESVVPHLDAVLPHSPYCRDVCRLFHRRGG